MSGYLLFICQEVLDRDALEKYWRGMDKALEGQGGEYVIAYGRFDRLEGLGAVEGVLLLRFPSFEQAKAWYNGAEYQSIKPLSQKGGKFLCAVMESGRWADPKDRMPHTIGRSSTKAS
jgi:uncharacterized protein (DUF1330 family)